MDTITINYHVTEKCNYSCYFCFAKYDLEDVFSYELHHNLCATQQMLTSIYEYFHDEMGVKEIRLNLAGGEPLLLTSFDAIIKIARDIGYKLSLITNGSAITKKFMEKHAHHFSMVGVSIDSFDTYTNNKIGRITRNNKTVSTDTLIQHLLFGKSLNKNLSIKVNTVVNQHNYNENMVTKINLLSPDKWKIFQVLTYNNMTGKLPSKKFHHFVDFHKSKVSSPIFIEDNDDMLESYIMIDPLGRFYQNNASQSGYFYSDKITDIGAKKAFSQINFSELKFNSRYISINSP